MMRFFEKICLTMMIALAAGSALTATTLEKEISVFVDIASSKLPPAQAIDKFKALRTNVETLLADPVVKNDKTLLSNASFLISAIDYRLISNYALAAGVPMSDPRFATLRKSYWDETVEACKTLQHQWACSNLFYAKRIGTAVDFLPKSELNDEEAVQYLKSGGGILTGHYIATVAWVFGFGMGGVKKDKELAHALAGLAVSRSGSFLIGTGLFVLDDRPRLLQAFKPFLQYENIGDNDAEQIKVARETLTVQKVGPTIKLLQTSSGGTEDLIRFYTALELATQNLAEPFNNWPASQLEFIWRDLLKATLQPSLLREADKRKNAFLETLGLSGKRLKLVNSQTDSLRSIFEMNWYPADSEYESLMPKDWPQN